MLLLGVFSLAAGLVVAFGISLVERTTDLALYGFSAAVIIPVGAIACGLVAAVGFYTASRALHVRAAGPALVIPLLTAVTAFFAAHWFTFTRYDLPTGMTFADAMALDGLGFVDYLRLVATESGIRMDSGSTSTGVERLGSWGYAIVAIQIAGFALGGWFVSSWLRQKPWCETSRRFLRKRGSYVRYFDQPLEFEANANRLVDVLERGGAVAAFEYAAVDKPTMKSKRKARFSVNTTYFECPDCAVTHTIIAAQHKASNNNWTLISQTPLHPDGALVDERESQLIS